MGDRRALGWIGERRRIWIPDAVGGKDGGSRSCGAGHRFIELPLNRELFIARFFQPTVFNPRESASRWQA